VFSVAIGGLITATILTLYVLPILYPWFSKDRIQETRSKKVLNEENELDRAHA
jgi:hypothetical protein